MEKYSQFRDKGTAIAPFFPVPTPPASALWTPIHILLFLVRLPMVAFLSVIHFLVLEYVPVGRTVRRCALWLLLAVPGVWWVDLQVDGVKRGGLAKHKDHLPHAGTIIASSFTSPLDPLYLAGIFSPIFMRSYPGSRNLEPITLFRAILLAFAPPTLTPPHPDKLISLRDLQRRFPDRIICVFPECTTTNGRGIMPVSECILSAGQDTKIYPVNLRYTPSDVTTPVPGGYVAWAWRLLSKPSHYMRVRIARHIYNNNSLDTPRGRVRNEKVGVEVEVSGYEDNIFDELRKVNEDGDVKEGKGVVSKEEQMVLDRVGEDLARLGRVKRVGLGVVDKVEFVRVWTRRRR